MPLIKVLPLILLIFSTTSCGESKMTRKDKVAAMVGQLEDPFAAITFTPQTLIDKSGAKDGALPFTYEAFATFFMSEGKTGIDNKGQVQIIIENSGGMLPNGYAFMPLSNSDNFKTLVTKELSAEVQEKNGVYYFRKDEDNYVVAWKEDIAIISNIPLSLDNLFSKGTNESKEAAVHLVSLLTEVSSKNINSEFRSFFDREGDVELYANGNSAYSIIDDMRFISKKNKAELKSLLDGTVLESSLNFEDGSIVFSNDFELSKELKDYAKILKSSGVDKEMLNYGLTENPWMVMSLNLSPKHFVKLMNKQRELMDAEGLESALAKVDLKLKDLNKLLTGEVVVMIDGVDSTERMYTNYEGEKVTYVSHQPNTAIIIGLKDAKGVQEAIDKMQSGVEVQKIDGLWYLIKEDKLVLTSTQDWLNRIKTGNAVAINSFIGNKDAFELYFNPVLGAQNGFDLDDDIGKFEEEMKTAVARISKDGAKLVVTMKEANKNALRAILERAVEAFEKQEKLNTYDLESILDDELLEEVESVVEETVEDIINSTK